MNVISQRILSQSLAFLSALTASSLLTGCIYGGSLDMTLPVCNIDPASEFPAFVPHDARPTRQLDFYVRLADSTGAPLANRRVMYSYGLPGDTVAGAPVRVFQHQFTTDANGMVIFGEASEVSIVVQGRYWENSTSSMSSFGAGALLGPLAVGGGRSTTTTDTGGGFYLRVSEEQLPIPLANGEYAGQLTVLDDTNPTVLTDVPLHSHTERESAVGQGVREAEFVNLRYQQCHSCRYGRPYHPNSNYYDISLTIGRRADGYSIFENYDMMFKRPPACAEIRTIAPADDTDRLVLNLTDYDLNPFSCEEFEAQLQNTSCVHDFTRVVFEEFRLP